MRHGKSASFFGFLALLSLLAPTRSAIGGESREARRIFMIGDGGGFLGVQLDEVDQKTVERLRLAEERGALVRKVEPDSPAGQAGLQADDVIVRYQGVTVESALQLSRLVRETPAGRKVALEVVREGAVREVTAALDERPSSFGPGPFHFALPDIDVDVPDFDVTDAGVDMPRLKMTHKWQEHGFPGIRRWTDPPKLGIKYQRISGQLARYFGLESEKGILVSSVDADGPAGKAGMKAGDVLVNISGEKIRSASGLHEALEDVEPGQEISVTVLRNGKTMDLMVVAGGARAEKDKTTLKDSKTDKDARIRIRETISRDKSI
ncbi:MAG: PDZ domain-containing protein [Vicinamibacteria bacterium]|nr:PDZ domain-containing protein [Vicinamibacteria bacterium]